MKKHKKNKIRIALIFKEEHKKEDAKRRIIEKKIRINEVEVEYNLLIEINIMYRFQTFQTNNILVSENIYDSLEKIEWK